MTLQSVVVDLATRNVKSVPTAELTVSSKHTGTFLRGQGFFSSAFTITNEHGTFLLGLDAHYQRLLQSYERLYQRRDFPITYKEFCGYIDVAIEKNKAANEHEQRLHCSIFCLAGPNIVV